ncbi:uncharacterized protein EMH_0086380 [Eimeria mitis]|uniref:Uncharacterized protein n=1 Tax=Eimeria mitis TaxID=44415 RepID=U6KEM8_9EIME|nr:uncharacterized protein EMH_0086380 [Eimeria mitis]CDJ33913.1 hypothetical protein, conserved [Eimeria mitis]
MSIVRTDSRPIENDEEGAYLSFDTASQGTLFLTWSKHSVPNALMHFTPRKPVPAFKYSTNQGRTELIRNCQVRTVYVREHKYQPACMHRNGLKSELLCCVQAFDGEVTMIDSAGPLKTQVWLHRADSNEVIKMECGQAYELNGVDGVAVTPLDSSALQAKTLTSNLFKEKAERAGASLMLN